MHMYNVSFIAYNYARTIRINIIILRYNYLATLLYRSYRHAHRHLSFVTFFGDFMYNHNMYNIYRR